MLHTHRSLRLVGIRENFRREVITKVHCSRKSNSILTEIDTRRRHLTKQTFLQVVSLSEAELVGTRVSFPNAKLWKIIFRNFNSNNIATKLKSSMQTCTIYSRPTLQHGFRPGFVLDQLSFANSGERTFVNHQRSGITSSLYVKFDRVRSRTVVDTERNRCERCVSHKSQAIVSKRDKKSTSVASKFQVFNTGLLTFFTNSPIIISAAEHQK